MARKSIVALLLLIVLIVLSSVASAEPTKEYPQGWTWQYFNMGYVFSEYDKFAPSPGCAEWLDKSVNYVPGKSNHQLPGFWMITSAARDAGWIVETDYTKPIVGAIVYHDLNAKTPNYSFSLKFIRNVENGIVTVETMNNEGQVLNWKIPVEKMQYWGKNIFQGYIYPRKVEDNRDKSDKK